MPLPDAVADCVTSNCVLNLSTRKRALYAEIFRILKPGGRLVFSDVATETPAAAAICNDPSLRGECIAGTLTLGDLFAILEESGFAAIRLRRRFPYRVVHGHEGADHLGAGLGCLRRTIGIAHGMSSLERQAILPGHITRPLPPGKRRPTAGLPGPGLARTRQSR